MVKVIKKGGKLQAFNKVKLEKGIKKAGCKKAKVCVTAIVKKISKRAKIKSSDLAKVVIAEMKKCCPRAAKSYAAFRAKKAKKKVVKKKKK